MLRESRIDHCHFLLQFEPFDIYLDQTKRKEHSSVVRSPFYTQTPGKSDGSEDSKATYRHQTRSKGFLVWTHLAEYNGRWCVSLRPRIHATWSQRTVSSALTSIPRSRYGSRLNNRCRYTGFLCRIMSTKIMTKSCSTYLSASLLQCSYGACGRMQDQLVRKGVTTSEMSVN